MWTLELFHYYKHKRKLEHLILRERVALGEKGERGENFLLDEHFCIVTRVWQSHDMCGRFVGGWGRFGVLKVAQRFDLWARPRFMSTPRVSMHPDYWESVQPSIRPEAKNAQRQTETETSLRRRQIGRAKTSWWWWYETSCAVTTWRNDWCGILRCKWVVEDNKIRAHRCNLRGVSAFCLCIFGAGGRVAQTEPRESPINTQPHAQISFGIFHLHNYTANMIRRDIDAHAQWPYIHMHTNHTKLILYYIDLKTYKLRTYAGPYGDGRTKLQSHAFQQCNSGIFRWWYLKRNECVSVYKNHKPISRHRVCVCWVVGHRCGCSNNNNDCVLYSVHL